MSEASSPSSSSASSNQNSGLKGINLKKLSCIFCIFRVQILPVDFLLPFAISNDTNMSTFNLPHRYSLLSVSVSYGSLGCRYLKFQLQWSGPYI